MPADAPPISVTDSSESLADWVEVKTLWDPDGNGSQVELKKSLQMSGTTDALDDEDESTSRVEAWEDPCEAAVEGAFSEIEDRYHACGSGGGAYPFAVSREFVARDGHTHESVYAFLLLLSRFGHSAGPKGLHGEQLFEDLCACAAEAYLGGEHSGVKSYVFGFPRRLAPSGFRPALDDLCGALGEGGGSRERPQTASQKDAGLDIVAWRSFEDERAGKLIAFGQCATGSNWKDKLVDLQPTDWCTLWMQDRPAVYPIRLFFVPHRVSHRDWFFRCVQGGILFDRCRIARYSFLVNEALKKRLAAWSSHVIASTEAL